VGVSRLWVFLALGLALVALAWGTQTCLYYLNQYLDPPQPIRAVEFQRLDDELLHCSLLGVDLVLAWPRDFPAWSAPRSTPLPRSDGY